MKNKKIILIISLILLLSLTMLLLASCNKDKSPFGIKDLYNDNSTTQLKITSKELSDLNDYTIKSTSNDFVLAYKAVPESTDFDFVLYNLATNTKLANFTINNANNVSLKVNKSFLACVTVLDKDGKTTVYHYTDKALLCSGDEAEYGVKELSPFGSIPCVIFNNDHYACLNKNGIAAVMAPSLSTPLYELQDYGDFYIYTKNSVNYVYDLEYNLIANYSLEQITTLATIDYDILSQNQIGSTVVLCLSKELDEDAKSYDYYELSSSNTKKYDYKVIYIDLKTGSYKTDDNAKIYVTDSTDIENDDDVLKYENFFFYRELSNKNFTAEKLGVFDNSGKLVLNLNDIVPSAIGVALMDDLFAILSDNSSNPSYHFFDSTGTSVMSIRSSDINKYYNGTFFMYKNALYNTKGELAFSAESEWSIKEFDYKTNGLVYYTLVKEIKEGETIKYINETYAYDTVSKKTTLIDNTGNIEFERGFYFTTDTENKTMSLYSVFDGTSIFKDQKFVDFSTYNCGDYTLIIGEKEDGTTTVYQCNNI